MAMAPVPARRRSRGITCSLGCIGTVLGIAAVVVFIYLMTRVDWVTVENDIKTLRNCAAAVIAPEGGWDCSISFR